MCWTCGFRDEGHTHPQLSDPLYLARRMEGPLPEKELFRMYPAWARRVRAALSEISCVGCGAGKYQELDGIAWLGFAHDGLGSRWRCGRCGERWEQ